MAQRQSALQLSSQLQAGSIDPVAYIEEIFDRIEADADQAIFTCLTRERSIAEAVSVRNRLRDGRSRSLLEGVPVAWKDLFDVAGLPTTAGAKILRTAAPADNDASVVSRLSEAGMVTVGRTNMSEFAFSGLGLNPHYGTPKNPAGHDVARIPGGSSSGSAVAVAAGLIPVSIGSDTSGSIRIPAAFNGIVGYKATRSRYSMNGVFPLARSLDSLGPLCWTVEDATLVDAAMRGLAGPSARRASLAGVPVLVPTNIVFDNAEAPVVAAFENGLSRLEMAGISVRRERVPAFDRIFETMATHGPLVTAEAYALHRNRLGGADADEMDRRVVARANLGRAITVADYLETLAVREQLIAEMSSLIGANGIVAYPTVAHVAPALAPLEADDDVFNAVNLKTLRNTLIGNFLEWCSVSLPCGVGDAGMPVGMLLSALPGRDDFLLSVALAAEAVIDRS